MLLTSAIDRERYFVAFNLLLKEYDKKEWKRKTISSHDFPQAASFKRSELCVQFMFDVPERTVTMGDGKGTRKWQL